MSDEAAIVMIAAAWSTAAALVGLAIVWSGRRLSLRVLVPAIALVSVAATVAGVYGTARAMFVSEHDFAVVLQVLTIAGVVALLAALAVGGVLSRWSRGLQAEAARFAESGDFVAPVGVPAELQDLSDELAHTSEKLRRAAEREAQLEASRRDLVSWVSHDLRTPLAGMRAMAEALEDGMVDDPARYHAQIRTEVERMARMVDDLFELSRIDAGTLTLNMEPVSLRDVVSEAIASADPVARARGVALGGNVEGDIEVRANAAELSRVVSNLVMNAIRHSPAASTVEVVGRMSAGAVELSVTDSCGGMALEDMERAFDVAWQGDASRTPDTASGGSSVFGSGAGLGLAIVKGIVEAHSGSITVHNQHPGCSFRVNLPAASGATA